MIRPLQKQLRIHRGILEERERIAALFSSSESGEASSLLDTDMRWKSEVKVECCMVNESETGSLLSNDEVSNGTCF